VVEFPDHHSYTHTQWQKLVHDSRAYDGLLTTEKDLVKLEHFSPALDRLLALRVQLQLEPAEVFIQTIEQRLRTRKKDRTDHGRTISH
jgi:tetraacyldisaccharide-1-P 4'-kinase